MIENGILISFEGISGAGKTALIKEFKPYLESKGYKTILKSDLTLYKGDGIGRDIKTILRKYSKANNDNPFFQFGFPIVETLLILAKRAFESKDRLNPELAQGKIVLSDRDIDTVCAYQLVSLSKINPNFDNKDLISIIRKINSLSTISPHLTFFLDVPLETAISRTEKRDNKTYSNEQKNFLRDAKRKFKEVIEIPLENRSLKKINTSNISINEVNEKAIRIFEKWIKNQQ